MLLIRKKDITVRRLNISIRIGIHTGPVVAGLLGKSRYQYDLWGHTVNLASRLESVCSVGCILVGKEMKNVLEGKCEFSESTLLALKNIGEVETFVLKNPRGTFQTDQLKQAV